MTRVVNVVFVLASDVQLLDVAGPAQVFSTIGAVTDTSCELRYVADTEIVASHQGLPLHAETDWPVLTAEDLVVVPGWQIGTAGRLPQPVSDALLVRIAHHHRRGGQVMSVCSGAFALAAAGLLDGHRATTHHAIQDRLVELYPRVRLVRDVLYVSDDRIHTSAGIASGIDLALNHVCDRLGARVAARIARAMVVYARRNGTQPQDSVMLRHRDHLDNLVHQAQDVIDERYAERLPLASLATQLAVSERTLTRAFVRALGITPLRYQQAIRRERAELLIGSGSTVEAAAWEVGFEDARMLRRLRSSHPHPVLPRGQSGGGRSVFR